MKRFAVVLLSLLVAGCVYVPVRQTVVAAGTAPSADGLAFLQPGVHKAEVLARLGPPAIDFRDIGIEVRSWKMKAGYLMVAYLGGGSVDQSHDLLIAYDGNDRLLAHAIEKRALAGQTMREHALDWRGRGSFDPAAISSSPLPELHVHLPTRACRAGLRRLRVLLDGEPVAELDDTGSLMTRTTPGPHQLRIEPSADLNQGQFRYDATPLQIVAAVGSPVHVRLCHASAREGGWFRGTYVLRQSLQLVPAQAVPALSR